jgi:hypothetical protein
MTNINMSDVGIGNVQQFRVFFIPGRYSKMPMGRQYAVILSQVRNQKLILVNFLALFAM